MLSKMVYNDVTIDKINTFKQNEEQLFPEVTAHSHKMKNL